MSDAQALARDAADRYVAALRDDYIAIGNRDFDPLFNGDEILAEIGRALRQEVGMGDDVEDVTLERRAGYLFGVQIGLRLRDAGGGR